MERRKIKGVEKGVCIGIKMKNWNKKYTNMEWNEEKRR
jgi:hypothetical protein